MVSGIIIMFGSNNHGYTEARRIFNYQLGVIIVSALAQGNLAV